MLWVTVLLFSVIAVAFLLVRLPEELDHVDDEVETSTVVEVCRGTPMEAYARGLDGRPGRSGSPTDARCTAWRRRTCCWC